MFEEFGQLRFKNATLQTKVVKWFLKSV